MRYSTWSVLVLALLLTAVGAGCETVNQVDPANSRANPNVVPDKRVITDSSLNSKARVIDIRETRASGDLLKIQAQILNKTLERRNFKWTVQWFDQDGIVIDSAIDSWKTMVLSGKELGTLTAVAPSPNAVDFRLKLIEDPSD